MTDRINPNYKGNDFVIVTSFKWEGGIQYNYHLTLNEEDMRKTLLELRREFGTGLEVLNIYRGVNKVGLKLVDSAVLRLGKGKSVDLAGLLS